MRREIFSYILWTLCATLWATVCFILPDFLDNPVEGWKGIATQVFYIVCCSGGTFFLLYLIGCNKYINVILLPVFAILGAGVSFYRQAYKVTITPMILEVTFHTNAEETMGVLSWQLMGWVCLNVVICVLFIWWRFKRIQLTHAWIHGLIALALGIGYFSCNSRLQNSLCQRYPYNIAYNLHQYLVLHRTITADRVMPDYSVIERPDSLTIVLVLGEAVRADHMQMNGYPRETNPHLMRRANCVSFPSIYSEQTHTYASLPYLLSRADSVNEDRQYTESSFISIMRKEHFYTAWISNQDLGYTFASFVAESDTVVFANAGKSVYVFSPWLDEELLPYMDKLEEVDRPLNLYVLHTIGSHWYYNYHVPETQSYFQPLTTNRLVSANSVEQLVNSYDNTIRYMDSVVNEVIERLVDKNALVIYQADHSEALGEDGEYLHANETEMAKHPACVIWYSDKFAANYPDKIKALITNKDKRYRTDYVFYSILSAAGIQAEGDTPAVNIFTLE